MRIPPSLLLMLLQGALVSSVVFPLERVVSSNHPIKLDKLKLKDKLRHSKRFKGSLSMPVGLYHSGSYHSGYYYTKLMVGTPAREIRALLDSENDKSWVTCITCSFCSASREIGMKLNYFDPNAPSTAEILSCTNNQCNYSVEYMDGSSTSGFYIRDEMRFEFDPRDGSAVTNSSFPVVFGCSTERGLTLVDGHKPIDGILGLGQGDRSIVSQLSTKGVAPNVFSHCFKGGDEGGGVLVFGKVVDHNMVYTPLVPSPQPNYHLNLQGIVVNGQVLPLDPSFFAKSTTMLDIGTDLAYFPSEAYHLLINAINTSSTASEFVTHTQFERDEHCYLVSNRSINLDKIFPVISLDFAGEASMALKPHHYLLNYGPRTYGSEADSNPTIWCIGFQMQFPFIKSPLIILGDLAMKDKIIEYDPRKQQIGVANNHDCSLPVNVTQNSSGSKQDPLIVVLFHCCLALLLLMYLWSHL